MIASAMKFVTNPNSWQSVDGTSSGPVNSFMLMWPALFGKDIGFVVARVTQIGLLGLTWLLFLIATNATLPAARVAIAASLVVFLSGTSSFDFLHYSSETASILLLMLSIVILFRQIDRPIRQSSFAVSGLFLGLVPYAKLQAAPIAVAIGIIQVLLILTGTNGRKRQSIVLLGFGAIFPSAVILGALFSVRAIEDFWISYIRWALQYINPLQSREDVWRIATYDPFLRRYFLGAMAFALAGVTFWIGGILRYDRSSLAKIGIAVIVLVASVYVVWQPGFVFQHYVLLLVFPAGLLAACLCPQSYHMTADRLCRHNAIARVGAACVIIFVALGDPGKLITAWNDTSARRFRPAITAAEDPFLAGNLLDVSGTPAQRMFVWGWMPALYSWSHLTPATRDIITYNQIWGSPLRPYFRSRMMSELTQRPPEYIVDAVALASFGFTRADLYGIASFSELAEFVEREYVLISKSPYPDQCPRTYARKTFAEQLALQFPVLTNFKSSAHLEAAETSFSAALLADNVLFDTCGDHWLLPDGSLGEVAFDLERPQMISSVLVLNTRNGRGGDRATIKARIEARGKNGVFAQEIRVLRHPYWTETAIPDGLGPVRSIRIEILQFEGLGGGLNEVRVRTAGR